MTSDLRRIESDRGLELLSDERYRNALRYLAGPPISEDDWKTLSLADSFSESRLRANPEWAARLVDVVLDAVDRRRFPWLAEQREPTAVERDAAVLASACLWAHQRTQTIRRASGKGRLEGATQRCMEGAGLAEVPRRRIRVLRDAPEPGMFCPETDVAGRRADFVVGLWDGRYALIECKDSNSLVNSVKRLNNDTAAKAVFWLEQFGTASVVPLAVISGVYYHESLEKAQQAGLRLIWEHGIEALAGWLRRVREAAQA